MANIQTVNPKEEKNKNFLLWLECKIAYKFMNISATTKKGEIKR